ncbi:hypothetical protein ACL02T_19520 [Pseudonocardia sp. RS010]|uniref:hypothetical protein n=1 Tax=Pseudonocardia sp. RS010 TaxID=3385979 RepID=UPI00399F505A
MRLRLIAGYWFIRTGAGSGDALRPWIVVGAGGVVYALVTFWAAGRLPDGAVPTHLAADGDADRFGTAGQVIGVWIALGVGMAALAVVTILVAQHGPLGAMNIPNRGYWTVPQRVQTVRRMLADDVAVVTGVTLAFLALVPLWMTLAANSLDGSLAPVAIWLPLVLYFVGLIAWVGWLVRVRYRPRDE